MDSGYPPRVPRLVVLGAINVDLVVTADRLPAPGETVVGGLFARHHGGTAGNQAVAAARALRDGPRDGTVAMIGAAGLDELGQDALVALDREGVAISSVRRLDDVVTGVAVIVVDRAGENLIAVAPGANSSVGEEEAHHGFGTAVEGAGADRHVLLASLEVPVTTVASVTRAARFLGCMVVLNAAPADGAAVLLDAVDVLVVNEMELLQVAAALGGAGEAPASVDDAIDLLGSAHPVLSVVVTLGAAGALTQQGTTRTHHAAPSVDAVDATGAGDTFCGVLAAGLLEGLSLADAATRATHAASLSVTVPGAREGMPLRERIEEVTAGRRGG